MRTTLITEFSLDRSSLTAKKIDLTTRKVLLEKAMVDNPESFTCVQNSDSFTWLLKPEIKNKYLSGFIKKYCRDFYGENPDWYKQKCEPLINYLLGFLKERSERYTRVIH